MIDECLKYGIEPLITMGRYEMPFHLVKEYGDFASRKMIDFFLKYAGTCFGRYKDKVKYWIPFNEINGPCIVMGESSLGDMYGLESFIPSIWTVRKRSPFLI